MPWFSLTLLNNTTLFANADSCSVLCLGSSNELNEPVCLCLAISWGCNGKSEQLPFLLSPGNPLLTCNLYWITPIIIVSPNVFLRIQIALHQHFISVDTKNKNHLPLPQQPLSRHCWARHLISSWSTRAVQWLTVEDLDYTHRNDCVLYSISNEKTISSVGNVGSSDTALLGTKESEYFNLC